jgi:hypothetical protein
MVDVGDDGEIADVVHEDCGSAKRSARERNAHKKKARPKGDAPSNKTYGNCLLGFHCSQKHPAENRASA